jgi:hypothetical protein
MRNLRQAGEEPYKVTKYLLPKNIHITIATCHS